MGAPINEPTAKEMCRVLQKDGVVILWGTENDPAILTFESVAEGMNIYKVDANNYTLNTPFTEIKLNDQDKPFVFSSSQNFPLVIGLP
jgi:hypothetical protein